MVPLDAALRLLTLLPLLAGVLFAVALLLAAVGIAQWWRNRRA